MASMGRLNAVFICEQTGGIVQKRAAQSANYLRRHLWQRQTGVCSERAIYYKRP
jgi:hypothetical protein